MANILLTSFTTWLPDQKSNSSDDLLQELQLRDTNGFTFSYLRRLPVDIQLASDRVIAEINELNPDTVICCGMSVRRPLLSLESNATSGDAVLYTNIDLGILDGLDEIQISHNAGKFVCEGLYYSTLKYIYDRNLKTRCIFVHVPILTEENMIPTMKSFMLILQKLGYL